MPDATLAQAVQRSRGLARSLRRWAHELPVDEREELALHGVMLAAQTFDPAYGVQFWTYCEARVRGVLYNAAKQVRRQRQQRLRYGRRHCRIWRGPTLAQGVEQQLALAQTIARVTRRLPPSQQRVVWAILHEESWVAAGRTAGVHASSFLMALKALRKRPDIGYIFQAL